VDGSGGGDRRDENTAAGDEREKSTGGGERRAENTVGGDRRDESTGDGEGRAGSTAGGDRVATALAELYGADPQAFTGRRGELVAAARNAGDRAAAKAIGALRRPTRAAWVVNRLARADPSAPPKLAELAAALRAAQQARNGPRLRELSAGRGALIDALTAQALAVAGLPDPPTALRDEVAATLTAALADPGVAADFASGTLTQAAHWSGFGLTAGGTDAGGTNAGEDAPAAGDWVAGGGSDADSPAGRTQGVLAARQTISQPKVAGPANAGQTVTGGSRRGAARSGPQAAGRPTAQVADAEAASAANAALAADAAQATQAAAQERAARLAEEAAELAARQRKAHEDAERLVASASAAATQAVAAEDRLEAEVHNLEDRLTQARADLATARLRARQAESAERRACQALDRLPK
jgi:hypothetical protein